MLKHSWKVVIAGLLMGGPTAGLCGEMAALAPATAPYTISVYDTDAGLPQNSVIAMTQTRDGYLWLGTLSGVVRFDGIQFTVFDEGNTPGLDSSWIVSLFEDSRSNLWIGTETAGIFLAKDGTVTSLVSNQDGSAGRLVAACEDSLGAVWLYSTTGRLWRYRDGRVQQFSFDANVRANYRTIIATDAGLLWIGSDWHLVAIDPTAAMDPPNLPVVQDFRMGRLDFLLRSREGGFWCLANGRIQKWKDNHPVRELASYNDLWAQRVTAACEDQQGNLIVGTLGDGLFWFDAEGKHTCLTTNQGLSHNSILSLLMDREGTLWVGTDGGGLNRVQHHVFNVMPETPGLTVQSVCPDQRGGLWVGCNGGEVGHWKNGEVEWLGFQQGLLNRSVKSMFVDTNQQVWMGTWASPGPGLFQFENGRFQRVVPGPEYPKVVQAIYQDPHGRLWFGTRSGLLRWDDRGWRRYSTRDGLSADIVQAIAGDQDQDLWIGTVRGGLNRLHDGQFTAYHKSDGLPSDNISSLYLDSEGVLWIGSSSGLARFQDGQFTRYTTREGLINNSLGYLLEDGQGYLWIASSAGLMRVPKQALNDFANGQTNFIPCRSYGHQDGLPISECTLGSQPGACRTSDGKLWFPTTRGLAFVDPTQLHSNTNPPPVIIESVLIDGVGQNTNAMRGGWPHSVTVPAGKEHLEIKYTSLNLAAPERARRFKYRMEGYETAWTPAGNIRSAHYSKLPPGHYVFQVTAANEDGVWNKAGSSLAVTVVPPVWRTWWFISGAVLLLLGSIIAVVHFVSTQKLQRQLAGLRQQEALEQERARIARDIHDQLGASMTQVAMLGELIESDKDAPEEVEAHAQQICQTARDTTRVLDEIVWTVNPANDTLEGLVNYICKNAQDYLTVAGLRYRLDVPTQLPATPIPPEVRHNVFLAAQEAVTNVVRHAHATEARLRLRLEPDHCVLEIEDNGRGLDPQSEQKGRNGLRNMRKRMEDIGGSFAIDPANDGGTLVRLTVRLGKSHG